MPMRVFSGSNKKSVKQAVASAFTSVANMFNVLPVAKYNATPLTLTDGQLVVLQGDLNGRLQVVSGGITKTVNGSVTRPNDTSGYTAGDVITTSTSAPDIITFSNVARINGGSGVIIGATLVDSVNNSPKNDYEIWLFDTEPTNQNDNVAFAPSDAELENMIGILSFQASTAKIGNTGSAGAGNLFYPSNLTNNMAYNCLAGSKDIYGVAVTRTTFTPVANAKLTVRLRVLQD
jgi:hypothetical protein